MTINNSSARESAEPVTEVTTANEKKKKKKKQTQKQEEESRNTQHSTVRNQTTTYHPPPASPGHTHTERDGRRDIHRTRVINPFTCGGVRRRAISFGHSFDSVHQCVWACMCVRVKALPAKHKTSGERTSVRLNTIRQTAQITIPQFQDDDESNACPE